MKPEALAPPDLKALLAGLAGSVGKGIPIYVPDVARAIYGDLFTAGRLRRRPPYQALR
jgi:hypothetical protein